MAQFPDFSTPFLFFSWNTFIIYLAYSIVIVVGLVEQKCSLTGYRERMLRRRHFSCCCWENVSLFQIAKKAAAAAAPSSDVRTLEKTATRSRIRKHNRGESLNKRTNERTNELLAKILDILFRWWKRNLVMYVCTAFEKANERY